MKALTKKRFELLLCGVLSCLPVFRGQAFSADSIAYHHVLLEDFGGTWCSNCPRVADSIAVLASDFDRLAVAGYQTAETRPDVSFLYNMDVYYRMCYYDTIRTVPALFVNGREVGNIRALRDSLENKAERFASCAALRCFVVAHFECPDIYTPFDSLSHSVIFRPNILAHIQHFQRPICASSPSCAQMEGA